MESMALGSKEPSPREVFHGDGEFKLLPKALVVQ